MKYRWKDIKNLPDEISLEDLRIVCHLSKSTARYYLQSGLIHCEHNGKKTHCYSIKKSDLISALKNYETSPHKFAIPGKVNAELNMNFAASNTTLFSLYRNKIR